MIMNRYFHNNCIEVLGDCNCEYEWNSFDSRNLKDGIFKVLYKGIEWDGLWFEGSISDKLIIILNGAYERKNGKPKFNRWSWKDIWNCNFLSIEDPMYKLYGVPTGWYFGDSENDYCVWVADIIKKIVKERKIKEIIFYSSSAGGTAAIRVANILNQGMVIALNPQLDITLYRNNSIKAIETIIGCKICEDKLCRNNHIIRSLKEKNNVKYCLIENLASETDYNYIQFCESEFDKELKFGCNFINNNIFMWIYEANDGINAHTAQDWREFLPFIMYMCENYRDGKIIDESLLLYFNGIWYNHFFCQKEYNKQLNKANFFELESSIMQGAAFKNMKQIENHLIKNSPSNCNFYKIPLEKDNSYYSCEIICDAKEFREYSFVVYDFKNVVRLFHKKCIVGKVEYINFLIGKNTENVAILIYTGMHGQTANKTLFIKNLLIKSSDIFDLMISTKNS